MIGFLRAHGMDPGPLQRPLAAGALAGAAATVPAAAVFVGFGSFVVAAARAMRLSRPLAALALVGAFTAAGVLYGLVFRRAANDRRGGWLFGAAFGFLLWVAAPVVVLPLMSAQVMAAGRAATGFFACFVLWGAAAGALFPYVHRPLQVRLGQGRKGAALGPLVAVSRRVLRRRPLRER